MNSNERNSQGDSVTCLFPSVCVCMYVRIPCENTMKERESLFALSSVKRTLLRELAVMELCIYMLIDRSASAIAPR